MIRIAILAAMALAFAAAAVEPAPSGHVHPYAGQEARAVKALSDDEIQGYLAGAGMGFAKAAELNGYPGPMHSLENAAALSLTTAQREALEALMLSHKQEARQLGADVVRLEKELDALFASRAATPVAIDAKVAQIAAANGRVRASHLKTHLKTAELLSAEQVERYNAARGYGARAKQ
jgi:Spy/CpxP family protein refolding chaperone